MNKKLGQEPAFPVKETKDTESIELGISKRLYIATMVLQGVVSNPKTMEIYMNETCADKDKIVAQGCFAWADELLKQEEND